MWVNDHHGLFPSCYDNATPTSWRRDDTLSELTADFHIHILACRRGFVNHHAPPAALSRPTALRRYLTPTPPGPLPRSGRIVGSASCVLRLHMGMGSHGPNIDRGNTPRYPLSRTPLGARTACQVLSHQGPRISRSHSNRQAMIRNVISRLNSATPTVRVTLPLTDQPEAGIITKLAHA